MDSNQSPFTPGTELVGELADLRVAVDVCLGRLARGELPSGVERERVDLKEEAGRRGSGGSLLPAAPENTSAASSLADDVACMANTPGGGALIVGVNDRTGDLLGTDLDPEWLRHQIYRRVDVAPLVESRRERGIRLLVLLVPEASEPVEDTSGRLRWRVAAHCQPVDRGAWWLHRQGRVGWDAMARPSRFGMDDVTPGAVAIARQYLRERPIADGLSDEPVPELLRRLGILTVSDQLTEAGALLFCPAPRAWLSFARLSVVGGEVLAAFEAAPGTSLIEQVRQVEALIEGANDRVALTGQFAEGVVQLLPRRTAREAVLNGLVHRDWFQSEPTAVTWVAADAALEVTSPGGFAGGVTATKALSQRYARSPALADAFRALGLVDRQGLGVDRMYREMVSLGHRPPLLLDEPGPRVRVRLVGGQPVVPVMRLIGGLEPRIRRDDVRVALILYTLLHEPFIDIRRSADVLQRTEDEAAESLETVAGCVIGGQPLIRPLRDAWVLSNASRSAVTGTAGDKGRLARSGVLSYVRPAPAEGDGVVRAWLAHADRITSSDYETLTGFSNAGARRALERMVDDGVLVRGDATGRNAHFRAGRAM